MTASALAAVSSASWSDRRIDACRWLVSIPHGEQLPLLPPEPLLRFAPPRRRRHRQAGARYRELPPRLLEHALPPHARHQLIRESSPISRGRQPPPVLPSRAVSIRTPFARFPRPGLCSSPPAEREPSPGACARSGRAPPQSPQTPLPPRAARSYPRTGKSGQEDPFRLSARFSSIGP